MNQLQSQNQLERITDTAHNSPTNIEIEQQQILLDDAYSLLSAILLIMVLGSVILIMLLSSLAYGLTFRIPIIFITILHLLNLMRDAILTSQNQGQNKDCCFQIVWSLCMISYYSCLMYFVDCMDFKIQYAIIFLFFLSLSWMIQSLYQLYKNKSQQNFEISFRVFIKLLFVGQLMMINFKLINWMISDWIYVFSPYIIVIIIFALLFLIQIFKVVRQMSQYLQKQQQVNRQELYCQIIGNIWFIILLYLFSIVGGHALIGSCIYLNCQLQINQILLSLINCGIAITIFLIYTVQFKSLIVIQIIQFKQFQNSLFYEQEQLNSTRSNKKYMFRLKDNRILSEYPSQMIKISSTYYLPDDTQKKVKTEPNQEREENVKQILNTEGLQDQPIKLCFSCCQEQCQAIYMPCGHGGLCLKCSKECVSLKQECLICRNPVQAILKIKQVNEQRVKTVDVILTNI